VKNKLLEQRGETLGCWLLFGSVRQSQSSVVCFSFPVTKLERVMFPHLSLLGSTNSKYILHMVSSVVFV